MKEETSSKYNPFVVSTPVKGESMSVPAILALLGDVDIDSAFGKTGSIKLNAAYNVLTTQLNCNLMVADLKAFNKYLQEQKSALQGEDFEFLNEDESTLDLAFLKQFLARNMN